MFPVEFGHVDECLAASLAALHPHSAGIPRASENRIVLRGHSADRRAGQGGLRAWALQPIAGLVIGLVGTLERSYQGRW
jgi:hypothetical protein